MKKYSIFLSLLLLVFSLNLNAATSTDIDYESEITTQPDYEIVIVDESDELLDWIDSLETLDELPEDATEEEIAVYEMIYNYKNRERVYQAKKIRAQKRTCSAINSSSASNGVASWYGPGFHGRKTANGERFNQNDLTAAHKTLPFGSIVEVTYRGKKIQVRINDAGPYSGGRIIDLSEAAAKALGMKNAGTGRVTLRLVTCGDT